MGTTRQSDAPEEAAAAGPSPARPPLVRQASRTAAVLLGTAVGVQVMVVLVLGLGRRPDAAVPASLTDRGRSVYVAERDVPLYVAGCAGTVALAWLLLRALDRRPRDTSAAWDGPNSDLAAASWLANLGLGVTLILGPIVWAGHAALADIRGPGWRWLVLPVPALLTWVFAWTRLRTGRFPRPAAWVRSLAARWTTAAAHEVAAVPRGGSDAPPSPAGRARWLADLAAVGLVVAIVLTPSVDRITGQSNLLDQHHHWNYFLMGPALGFRAGKALGTEVYSQYGVLWPVLFATLDPVLPLDHGRVIAVAVAYACLYYVGLYLLLRRLLPGVAWAAAGTFAVLLATLFRGLPDGTTLWIWPSSSLLRMPVDVWFFLALVQHLRTGRTGWALAAAALAGLAVLAGIDTGVELTATLVLYALGRVYLGLGGPFAWRKTAARAALGAVCFLAVLVTGLAVASRGTLLRAGFWTGWLEGPLVYGGGFSALPVADGLTGTTLRFAVMAQAYLSAFALGLDRAADPASRTRRLFWACWGAYGLGTMLLFVNRSHPFNLDHVSLPFVGLAVSLLAWLTRQAAVLLGGTDPPAQRRVLGLAGMAALSVAVAALVTRPTFRCYPNLANAALAWTGDGARTLRPAPRPLRAGPAYDPDTVQAARDMAARRGAGGTVGVLHPDDTNFYLLAGCAPPVRYSPLVPQLFTADLLERAVRDFFAAGPDCVVEVRDPGPETFFSPEVWARFHAVLERDYERANAVGPLDVWQRRKTAIEAPAAAAGS